jgi:ABC-type glycerol-3-phosphate transport system substrate-binding protein
MYQILKRITASILLLVMLVSLSACGGKTSGNANSGGAKAAVYNSKDLKKIKLEHVYSIQYIDAKLQEGEFVTGIRCAGDKIYVITYYSQSEEAEGETVTKTGSNLYSMNLDGTNFGLVTSFRDVNESNEEEGSTTYTNTSSITPCSDGTLWYYTQTSVSIPASFSYTSTGKLIHADTGGNVLASIDSATLSQSPYFYIMNMFICPNGDLVLSTGDSISVVSAQGTVKYSVPTNNAYFTGLTITGNGEIVGIKNSFDMVTFASNMTLVKLNEDTKSFDDLGTVPVTNTQSFIGGEGSTVIINSGSSVYIYDINTKEMKEVLNWINSDMNFNRVQNFTVLPEGKYMISEYTNGYQDLSFGILSKKSEADIIEKYVINFASVYLDSNLQDAIIQFNRQNDEYRIQYVDYSIYNTSSDYNAGVNQLNYDIVSGQIPDLFSMYGLPYSTYASKGLLADIGALMDADTSFDKTKYLENVLNAPTFNGKIYSVIPAFTVMTVAGKSENVGTTPGWTMDGLKTLMQKYPDAQVFSNTSKTNVLSSFSNMAMNSYIDFNTGVCSFNSDSFIKMLEFLNTFPDAVDYGAGGGYFGMGQDNTQYSQNKTLLNTQSLYSYTQMRDLASTFGGDFTFIGFPVPEGVGTTISPSLEVAISSRTKLTDVCWDFVKYLLSENYQNQISYGFPIYKSCLDNLAQKAMTETTSATRSFGGFGGFGGMFGMGANQAQEVEPITQAQVDQMNDTILTVNSVQRSNTEILAIIEEEAGAYFANQKTAAAVADTIQSRVQIYLNENR